MADMTFEFDSGVAFSVVFTSATAAFFVVMAGRAVDEDEPAAVAGFLALACLTVGWGIKTVWSSPSSATLTDAGVVLASRFRKVVIPWGQLWAVRVRPADDNNLRWEYGHGKVLHTTASFGGLTTMLAEIRRRSPGTELP